MIRQTEHECNKFLQHQREDGKSIKRPQELFFLHLESLKQSALQFNVCHPGGGGQSQNAGNDDVLLYLSLFISLFLL